MVKCIVDDNATAISASEPPKPRVVVGYEMLHLLEVVMRTVDIVYLMSRI